MGQVCWGHYGSEAGFLGTVWQWDRFVGDSMAVGQVYWGQYGIGTGLLWTVWQWDRFIGDSMALGQVFLPVLLFPCQ